MSGADFRLLRNEVGDEDFQSRSAPSSDSSETRVYDHPAAPPPQYEQTVAGYYPAVPQQQLNTNVIISQQQSQDGMYAIYSRPNDYFGLALFACLCCFCPLGLVALFYSADVNSTFERGNVAKAKRSSTLAHQFALLAIGFGSILFIISVVVLLVLMVLRSAAGP